MRKFMRRFTSGILAAAMVASLVSVAPKITVEAEETWKETTLVSNGDFESCDEAISNWDVTDWLASNGLWYVDLSADQWAGNTTTALKTNNDSDSVSKLGISQIISEVPAGTYKVSVRSMGTANTNSGIILSISDGTNSESVELNATDSWGKWVTSETKGITLTTEGTLTVSLTGTVPSKYYGYVDDIVISSMDTSSQNDGDSFTEKEDWEWSDSEKIINGGFETGDTTGWTITNESFAIDNGTYNSGTYALKTKWSDNDPVETSVTQTVKLDEGWYYLSFAQEGAEATSELTISIGDISKKCVATTGWGSWKSYDLDYFYVSEEKDYTISITGNVPAGYYGSIDDIILYKYAEKKVDTTVYDAEITVDKVKNLSDDFMLGTDISAVQSIFDSGASYYDEDGKKLDEDGFFKLLANNGVNWVRIRVWNDPYDEDGNGYGGGNNDIEKAVKMGKYATDAGMKVLIDFHYSDFWADPSKQKAPKKWENYTVAQKADAVYDFTKKSLESLKNAGVDVGMIQVGNETTGGSICGIKQDDWDNSSKIFAAGSKAARDVDDNILVAVHFTNPEKQYYSTYAEKLKTYNVDYDVFASSYYPSWHGSLKNLNAELDKIAKNYDKKVIVAETSYAWTLEEGDGHENTIIKGNNDSSEDLIYPFSVNGQAKWVRDVVDTVNSTTNGCGVFYWEAAWIPVQKYDATSDDAETVLESNKKKWEEFGSGWASSYAKEYDPVDAGVWYGGSAIDNQAFFDFDGKVLPSLKVYQYLKTGSVAANISVDSVKDSEAETLYSENLSEDIKSVLPKKVTLNLSDASKEEVDVIWNEDDINYAVTNSSTDKFATFDINGTVTYTDGEAYSAKCALTVKPKNLLIDCNNSFEDGEDKWEFEGSGYDINTSDVFDGEKTLHYWKETADTFTAKQTIVLKPGVYSITANAQGYEKDKGFLFSQVGDGRQSTSEFELSGWKNWKSPLIENITVKATSEFTFGVTMDYQAGGWGTIDYFYLYKTDNISAEDEAAEIDALIDAIGKVSVDKEKAIDTANTAFDGASEEAKELVSKADVLEAANDKLVQLKSDIADVEERIDAIDKEITLESNDKITAAREAYDALPAESKKEVDEEKYAALEAAEKKYNELKAADDKLTKDASDVDSLITAIGVITSLDQKSAVDAARKAYDELLADAKAKVKNEAVLKAAETEIAKLEKAEQAKAAAAADADMYINAIGTVTTLNSMATVEYARKVYDALTDEQKALVKNYDKLVAAEKAIEELVFEATPAAQDEKITEVTTNAQYKVTKVPEYDGAVGTVTYTAPADNTAETVTIPATITYHGVKYKVTAIADNTFKGNKKIQSVTIGANISKIGKKAFYNCKNLKKITIKTSKLTTSKVGANAFKNIKKTATIKVPAKKLKAYKKLLKKKGVTSKAKIKK